MSLALLTHVHLLLNHFPTIGFMIGLGLFVPALARKSDHAMRAGLVIFFLIALLAIPTYMTGKAAAQAIADQPGVSQALIDTHQDSALLALVFIEITGFAAWLGLWQFRRFPRTARKTLSAVLVLATVTVVLMGRTAYMGSEIRHPEIVPDGAASNTELVKTASIKGFVDTTAWAWPATETLHFIGLSLLLGVVLMINLRMLGVMKNVSYAALHRLLPWGMLGFAINLMTGVVFFVTVPEQYTENIALHVKMILMLFGGVNVLYFTMFDQAWALKPGDDAPLTAKVVAVSTIILWVGVIYFGRMMPFIGGSF